MILPLAIAVALGAPPAADPFTLEWEAPQGCPSGAEIAANIERFLDAALVPPRGDGLRVRGRVLEKEGTWVIELRVTTPDVESVRALPPSPTCEEAAQAAALIVAIAIDPSAAERAAESVTDTAGDTDFVPPEPKVDQDTPPAAEPEPGPPQPGPVVEPPPPPKRKPLFGEARGVAGLEGGVGFGALPRVGGGIGGYAGLLLPRLRVEATIRFWFPRGVGAGGANVDFGLWTIGARACPVFTFVDLIELQPCGGIEAGQTLARSEGLANAQDPSEAWIAITIRPALVIAPLRYLAVGIAPEAVIPLRRPSFDVGGFGEVFQATAVGVRGLLAVEARFP